jgi:hypothetical protein
MEPQASNSPDSHMVRSSAAVKQAYAGMPSNQTANQRQAASGVPAPLPPTTQPALPAAPADEAAMEQEWIEKAKEVVLRTQDDPFMQNKLLSELKAQYLAARYGRGTGIGHNK